MKKLLFLIAVVLTTIGYSQQNFPSSWEGTYKGSLEIYGVDSVKMLADMQMEIEKKSDSVYSWILTYTFNGNEDKRAYELLVKDAKKGHYIIDEKNSIEIDAFYKSEILTSFFKVQNSFIISTYTKVDDVLQFEIISANEENVITTGNSEMNDEKIPEVSSYLVNGRQKALLKLITDE